MFLLLEFEKKVERKSTNIFYGEIVYSRENNNLYNYILAWI